MNKKRGSEAAIAEIVRMSKGISVSQMATLAELATNAGGRLMAVSAGDDDDWCGNGRIILKWPPKQKEFYHLFNTLVEMRINYEVLINGIPVPDEIMINVNTMARW